jgi:phenylpyruvate tautomerase PptA (4-oxalocrotonate tautomerase family)
MPHISIKHFPVALRSEQQEELVAAVTEAATEAFGCDEGAVSIILEPIDQRLWKQQVYIPEIRNRRHLLSKVPDYDMDSD